MDGDIKLVLRYFVTWRLFLFVPLLLAPQLISMREGFEYEYIKNSLVFPWANFDGVHYLSIAGLGYKLGGNFFPLYPLLIRFFSFGANAFGLWQFLAALLISNFSFLGACVLLYKIVKAEFSAKIAKWAIIFMLVFPTSFFFASVYSESTFLFLLLLSFWFFQKEKWFLSAVSGALLSATRLVGVALLPALLYKHRKLTFFLIPLGTLLYAIYNYIKWGDPLNFIKVHGQLANSRSVDTIILFPQTLYRYSKIFLSLPISQFEWWIALLEVSSFFLTSGLLYIAFRKRVKISYLIFAALSFLVPVSSGTFSGLPRYILVLFPIYIALALIANKNVKTLIIIIFSILQAILFMFFARGYYIS